MNVKTVYRKISDLDDENWMSDKLDPEGTLAIGVAKAKTFKENPYVSDSTTPVQAVGLSGQDVVGKINQLWYDIFAEGKRYRVVSGEDLFVYEKFRSTMYGVKLLDGLKAFSPDRIVMGCRYSALAQKVIALLRYHIFPLRHFYLIRHSEKFVSSHLRPSLVRVGAFVTDFIFAIWRSLLSLMAWVRTHEVTIRIMELSDSEGLKKIEDVVASDTHRFREDITANWLKWVVGNDFCEGARKKLYGYYREDRLIGFALVRFMADGKGKGELLEWQFVPDYRGKEAHLILRSLIKLVAHCDFAMLMFDAENAELNNFFKRKLVRRKDDLAALYVAPDSPLRRHLGYEEARNWRIRPALGDSCFW